MTRVLSNCLTPKRTHKRKQTSEHRTGGAVDNKPYHNKGFGMAFFVVFLLLIPLPILGLWAVDGQDCGQIYD